MKTVAVLPWRSGDRNREQAFEFVTNHLTASGTQWIASDSGDEKFSRGASKNRGAAEAFLGGADVVIFHDADMLIEKHWYPQLAEMAYTEDRLVIGYTEYKALTKAGTAQALRGRVSPFRASVAGNTVGWSLGGIIAVSSMAFAQSGGYDERFRGWGCEDFAFAIACRTALGENRRMPNEAVHLWHEHGKATQAEDDERFNGKLLGRYNQITCVEDLRSIQNTQEV